MQVYYYVDGSMHGIHIDYVKPPQMQIDIFWEAEKSMNDLRRPCLNGCRGRSRNRERGGA